MKKYLSTFIVLPFLFASHAYATDFFVTVEGGRASSDFKPPYTTDGTHESANSTAYSASAGLKFQSQFVLGAGFSGSSSDSFMGGFDDYEIWQEQLYLGYRFNINDHFRITPQVGFAHWELSAEKAKLFGDENDKKSEYSGNDIYGQINLEFPVSKLITVVCSYSRTHYDFGNTSSAQAGVIFEFD